MEHGADSSGVWRWGVGLAVLHVALALIYAWITPYCTPGMTNGRVLPDIGAPDEQAHAHYIEHIGAAGLPVLDPKSEFLQYTYEFHQPPAYYVMAYGWCQLVGVPDPILPSAGFRVRALSCLIGGTTILGVFFLALWSTRRRDLAIYAAAAAALLPMLCAVDGAVSNDPLLICLCTWTMALLAKWAERWSVLKALAIGLLIGAAIVTKSTGVLLIPVALCAMLIGGWRRNLLPAAVAVVVGLGVALPLFFRNHQLYGDFLGMRAFYQAYPATVDPSPFSAPRALAHWIYVLGTGTMLSFVGEFGYMDIHLPYWIYVPVLGVVLLALVRSIRSGVDVPGKGLRASMQVLVWGAVLLYVAFNLRYVQPQARYLFPAIGVLALWVVIGAARTWRFGPAVLVAMLALANLTALTILPGEFQARVEGAKERAAQAAK